MNEFERRLYDYMVEDGGSCPPCFLLTALDVDDFDALLEALSSLASMGAVENGPQGYRVCKGWQEVSRENGVAGLSDAHTSSNDRRTLEMDSLPCRHVCDASNNEDGQPSVVKNLGSHLEGDCGDQVAALETECVQTATCGPFEGMTDQEVEQVFQGIFEEQGIKEAQLVDSELIGFGESSAGASPNDVLMPTAAVALEECDICEPAEREQKYIALHDDALDKVGLPTRAASTLEQLGISTVEQLCCLSTLTRYQDIGQIPSLGCKTKEETYAWLDAHACHIDDEAFCHLSQFERDFRFKTDYFINRLGLLCTFDCADGRSSAPIHDVHNYDSLMCLSLDALKGPGFSKAMVRSLERHGFRTVKDLMAMDTDRVLCYRGWGASKKRKLDDLIGQLRAQPEVGDYSELHVNLGCYSSSVPRLAFSVGYEPLLEDAQSLAMGLVELGYSLYMPTATPWLNACAKEGLGPHEAAVCLIGREPAPEAIDYLASILCRRLNEVVNKFRQGDADTCSIPVPDAPGWSDAAYECCDEDEDLSFDEHTRLLIKKTLTLDEWIASIENDVKRTILSMRLAGSTLQEAADKVELTRERARQIEKQTLEASPVLSMMQFRRLVDSYELSEAQFVDMGFGSPSEYRYLVKTACKKGDRLPLAGVSHNPEISDAIKNKVAAYINKEQRKYCVQVDDGIVRIDKTEIAQYLLEKAAKDGRSSLTIGELLQRYRDFCGRYELEGRRGTEPGNADAFLAYLQRRDTVLAPNGQSVRLYDFNAYDYSDLETALDSMRGESIECSARIIVRRFPGLLDEYDLLDEYELHFVIKRLNYDKSIGFELGRTPMIKFGDADRKNQVMDIIRGRGSISADDLAAAYEEKYGVAQDTLKAYLSKHMGQYRHGHTYSMSEEPLTNRERRWLEAELEGVTYIPLEFIRQRFIDEFSLEASQKICDCNLSLLGFEVSEDLIVSRSIDIDAAFSQLLDGLTFTFEGEEGLSAEVMTHSLFRSGLDSRLRQFRLIKFDNGKDGRAVFVSDTYLNERFSVDADLMRLYVRRVIEFVGRDNPFTIKSLRDGGFVHSLDLIRGDIRFGDSFFESVLSAGIGNLRIGTSSCRGVKIFCVTSAPFSSVSLFEYLVAREGYVELDELQGILRDEFGIEAEPTYMRSVVAKSHIVSRPGDMLFTSDEAYAEFRDALFAAM